MSVSKKKNIIYYKNFTVEIIKDKIENNNNNINDLIISYE